MNFGYFKDENNVKDNTMWEKSVTKFCWLISEFFKVGGKIIFNYHFSITEKGFVYH